MSLKVAMIGCGYWGPNLLRVLAQNPKISVYALCDLQPTVLQSMSQQYAKEALLLNDYHELLNDQQVEAVVVATPAATHFEIACAFLKAGKHVFVEKPLALTSADCRTLVNLAKQNEKILMVGHVFMYNAAVNKAKEYIESGELGEIFYVYSQRLNLGRIQTDLNCLWSFAPHDVSILCYWLNQMPVKVTTQGFSYLHQSIEDVVFSTLSFPNGVGAHMHLSWLDPRKVRTITIVGSKKMLVYDDVSTEARLQIYDKGVDKVFGERNQPAGNFGEFQMQLRTGDLLVPYFKFTEPLVDEMNHFLQAVQTGNSPRTDGVAGLKIVEVLEAMDKSLKSGGLPVTIGE